MGRVDDQENQGPRTNNTPPSQFQQETVDIPQPHYESFYNNEYQHDMYPPPPQEIDQKPLQQPPPPPPFQQAPNPQPARPVPFPSPSPQSNEPKPVSFPPPQEFPPRVNPHQAQHGFASPAVQFPPAASFQTPVHGGGPQQMPQSPYRVQGVVPGTPINVRTQGWKTGLFDCMEDPENALITACFPCLTFGQIAEIIDQGQSPCATSGTLYCVIAFCIAMPCLVSCTYRTKLRSKFGLIESPAPDWVTHCFCEWCALCQEYRELQARGIDPSIGWQGNVAKIQQQVAMMPPMNQRMTG